MAMNVCPHCKGVTLGFGDEAQIKCPVCNTVFETEDEKNEDEY